MRSSAARCRSTCRSSPGSPSTWTASPPLTAAIRKVHDFLTVGAPAPLQEAVAVAMERLGPDYYAGLAVEYRRRRDLLVEALRAAGCRCTPPEGAYYVLADYSEVSPLDDVAFARELILTRGVACVPGSSFHARPDPARRRVRFAFCKTEALLEEAGRRLRGGGR